MTEELQKPKLSALAKKLVPSAQQRINNSRCPLCSTIINGVADFENSASIKEYSISGMCQTC